MLAARTLLTADFYHLMSDEDLDRVLNVAARDAEVWGYLVAFNQPDTVRRQAALLMSLGRWQAALSWLEFLPAMDLSPRDLTAQAAIHLAQQDVDGALAVLQPATDPDWRAAKAFWQPDRWQSNHAARMYDLLRGDIAMREARYGDAVSAYQRAVDDGADLPGRYFLAQALEQVGQEARAQQIQAELEAEGPVPELVPLLSMADGQAIYAMQPQVTRAAGEGVLTVTATYGDFQPHVGYPLQFWRIEVVSPDGTMRYAQQDVPAAFVEDALTRISAALTLEPDIAPLTPALVVVTPAHDNAVTTQPAFLPVTLNRPESAAIPPEAIQADLSFGDSIHLNAYTVEVDANRIDVRLYWQTDAPLPEDYQVFVHVLDEAGEIIVQDDSPPVQGRYPTSQWRLDTTILDEHQLAADDLPEHFSIRVGLYSLVTGLRLPVSPATADIESSRVLIYQE